MSLETDYTTVPGQVFACLSIIGPEAPQKNDKFGIKIRGAFATRDEAANHAKRLQKEDTTFDIYVVDMYKWLLIPPDSSKIEDVHYNNEKLEEIMSGYKDNQAQAARMFSERKQGMMKDKVAYAPGDDNSQFYTKPDEAPISHPADVLERLKKEKPDTPMEELVKEANVIVAAEVEERKKQRELEDVKEGEEEEEASV
jgi:protease II